MTFDTDGNELGPNLNQPLYWDSELNHYVHAFPESVNHFHRYDSNPVELVVE